MKNTFLFIIVFIICGCVPKTTLIEPDIINYEGVLYIGDSLCNLSTGGGPTAQQIVGIERDCRNGRRLTQYTPPLPSGYELIFLALATNDVRHGTHPETYGQLLEDKISNSSATVYCVLPITTGDHDSAPYREQMTLKCTNIIDPLDWGVVFNGTIHWGDQEHINFSQALYHVLDLMAIEPIAE